MRRQDRHRHKPIRIALVQFLRQARRFSAEDQDDVARIAERHIPERSCGLGREEVRGSEGRHLLLECIPAWPDMRLDMFPVIEAGPLYLTFTELKSKRCN